jgi:hypothetical protein
VSISSDVHQLEFRWKAGKDLYPIAFSAASADAPAWYRRLSGFARPPQPAPHLGVPDRSIVYAVLRDGSAAVVWRCFDQYAIPLDGTAQRHPLVARALVGDVSALTPDVAVALCQTDWQALAGPPPGQAKPGEHLPVISAARLSELVAGAADGLDELAREAAELPDVIATALRHWQMPLCVQLPEHAMGQDPARGPQARLVWGLLRTIAPLSSRQDGRNWAFSTYEPPLNATDTRWLTDIVFRVDKPPRPSQNGRMEAVVRPLASGQHLSPGLHSDVAHRLTEVYRRYPPRRLAQFLSRVAADYPDWTERLRALAREMESGQGEPDTRATRGPAAGHQVTGIQAAGFQAAAAGTQAEGTGPQSRLTGPDVPDDGTEAIADPAWQDPYAEVDPAGRTAWDNAYVTTAGPGPAAGAADFGSSAHDPAAEQEPPEGAGTGPWHLAETGHASARSLRGKPTPLQEPSGHRMPHGAAGHQDAEILRLLRQLSGPQDQHLAAAADQLRHGRPPLPPAADRASARDLMTGHGWYVTALAGHDPHGTLAALFGLVVVPDLGTAAVAEDVGRWAGDYEAPPVVIRALAAAADHSGEASLRLLEHALRPALSRRWLGEHGVTELAPDASRPASSRPPGRRRAGNGRNPSHIWQLFPADPAGGIIASLLVWLCFLQVIALVVIFLRV